MTTTMRLSGTAQTDYDDDSSRPDSGPDWGLGFTAKQLADLVGVTVRTLRYYHQIGLLAEPRRAPGGLRYTPEHALRVLRIKRLTLIGLALDEVADVLGSPTSPRAARILADLDRALADRAVEIQAQRRVIRQLQDTDSPVDVLPEFARHLATLRRLSATGDTERADQALIDIVAGGADASAAQAGLDLLDQVTDDPDVERLTALEGRLHSLGPAADEQEVAGLALAYGQVLSDLYDAFTEGRTGHVWSRHGATKDLMSTLVGPTNNLRQRDVVSRAATVLAAHAASVTEISTPRHTSA